MSNTVEINTKLNKALKRHGENVKKMIDFTIKTFDHDHSKIEQFFQSIAVEDEICLLEAFEDILDKKVRLFIHNYLNNLIIEHVQNLGFIGKKTYL